MNSDRNNNETTIKVFLHHNMAHKRHYLRVKLKDIDTMSVLDFKKQLFDQHPPAKDVCVAPPDFQKVIYRGKIFHDKQLFREIVEHDMMQVDYETGKDISMYQFSKSGEPQGLISVMQWPRNDNHLRQIYTVLAYPGATLRPEIIAHGLNVDEEQVYKIIKFLEKAQLIKVERQTQQAPRNNDLEPTDEFELLQSISNTNLQTVSLENSRPRWFSMPPMFYDPNDHNVRHSLESHAHANNHNRNNSNQHQHVHEQQHHVHADVQRVRAENSHSGRNSTANSVDIDDFSQFLRQLIGNLNDNGNDDNGHVHIDENENKHDHDDTSETLHQRNRVIEEFDRQFNQAMEHLGNVQNLNSSFHSFDTIATSSRLEPIRSVSASQEMDSDESDDAPVQDSKNSENDVKQSDI